MAQKSSKYALKGSALENRALETALRNNNGWLHMVAGQLREWAQDIIRDDRLTTASILELEGYRDAAVALRGYGFNLNDAKRRAA